MGGNGRDFVPYPGACGWILINITPPKDKIVYLSEEIS
jgi:hypothetical protein